MSTTKKATRGPNGIAYTSRVPDSVERGSVTITFKGTQPQQQRVVEALVAMVELVDPDGWVVGTVNFDLPNLPGAPAATWMTEQEAIAHSTLCAHASDPVAEAIRAAL